MPATQTQTEPLTLGELYTALILAASPSAMGIALAKLSDKPGATLEDWSAEIATVQDTPEAIAALQGLLKDPRFNGLFKSFLTNDSLNGAFFNAAAMMQNKLWQFSQTPGVLAQPWINPPHPPGDNVARLIDHMKDFQETAASA